MLVFAVPGLLLMTSGVLLVHLAAIAPWRAAVAAAASAEGSPGPGPEPSTSISAQVRIKFATHKKFFTKNLKVELNSS
jgi:hypothetical protein